MAASENDLKIHIAYVDYSAFGKGSENVSLQWGIISKQSFHFKVFGNKHNTDDKYIPFVHFMLPCSYIPTNQRTRQPVLFIFLYRWVFLQLFVECI